MIINIILTHSKVSGDIEIQLNTDMDDINNIWIPDWINKGYEIKSIESIN